MAAMLAAQPTLDPLDDAEAIFLAFSGVLLGGDGHGAGLLSKRVDGRFHTRGCQIGMYIRDGDSLRGGQPCSDRCESAREALSATARWMRSREARR